MDQPAKATSIKWSIASSPTEPKRSPLRAVSRQLSKLLLATKRVKVLPPIESSPIILIKFTSKAKTDLISLVHERLNEDRINVVTQEEDSDGNVMWGITTTQQELELEAEHLSLLKPSKLNGLRASMEIFEGTIIMDPFQVDNRESFRIERDPKDDVPVYDTSGIFTSADRVMLLNTLIESFSILRPGVESSNLARKLNETLKIPTSEMSARFHKMYLFDILRNLGFVDVVAPIHANYIKNNILAEIFNAATPVPIQAIRDYYGEEVAFYFAWMKFYIKSLLLPGVSGLIIFMNRYVQGGSIDTDPLTPFHGLFTFIWAILFVQFWKREEARLAYKWGTYSTDKRKESLSVRHEFQGIMRVSEVTKMMEKYYPSNKRRLKYWLVSAYFSADCLFLCLLITINVCFCNLQHQWIGDVNTTGRCIFCHDTEFKHAGLHQTQTHKDEFLYAN